MTLLLDTTNIYRCGRAKFGSSSRLKYEEFIPAIESMFGEQDTKIAYVARPSNKAEGFITFLESLGLEIKAKEPREFEIEPNKKWKLVDWSVDMAIDALEHCDKNQPTIICSSDYRLEPLVQTLQDRVGIVIVWAVGIPSRFNCTCKEIGLEFIKNVDTNIVAT